MTVKIKTTRQSAENQPLRAFVYGLPGAGKTFFASTFPSPLFVVPGSSFQSLGEHELLTENKRKTMVDRDWGEILNLALHGKICLHRSPVNTLWIAHAWEKSVTEKGASGKSESYQIGGYNVKGQAQQAIPSECSLLCYMECIANQVRSLYRLHARPYRHWPARGHFVHSGPRFTMISTDPKNPEVVHPCYNDIAPYFNLPSLEEAEVE